MAGITGLRINGPMTESYPTVLSGASPSGVPVAIKILLASSSEMNICESLQLRGFSEETQTATGMINGSLIDILHHDTSDVAAFGRAPGHFKALVMPRYVCTLAQLPQLHDDALATGGEAMCAALDYVHSKSLVHMDVKASNVFINGQGRWHLGDFGSCVEIGGGVISYTDCFHPSSKKLAVAEIAFDMDFLLSMLVIEIHKTDDAWKTILYKDGRLCADSILRACRSVTHESLAALLSRLQSLLSASFCA